MKHFLSIILLLTSVNNFAQTGILAAKSRSQNTTLPTIKDDNFGLPNDELDSIIYIGNHCIIQVIRKYGYGEAYHDTLCDPYIFEENNYDLKVIKQMYPQNVIFVGFEKFKKEKNTSRNQRNSLEFIAFLLLGGMLFSSKQVRKKLPVAMILLLLGFCNELNAQTGIIALKSQSRNISNLNSNDDTFGGPELENIEPLSRIITIRYLGNCTIEMTRKSTFASITSDSEAYETNLFIDTINGMYSMHNEDFTMDNFKQNFDQNVLFTDFIKLTKERKKLTRKSKKENKKSTGFIWVVIGIGIISLFFSSNEKPVIA